MNHSIIVAFSCLLLSVSASSSSCVIDIDGEHWPHKPAILTSIEGDPVLPHGGDGETRIIELPQGDQFELSCPGTYLTIGAFTKAEFTI